MRFCKQQNMLVFKMTIRDETLRSWFLFMIIQEIWGLISSLYQNPNPTHQQTTFLFNNVNGILNNLYVINKDMTLTGIQFPT